jgi:hypothetical protein
MDLILACVIYCTTMYYSGLLGSMLFGTDGQLASHKRQECLGQSQVTANRTKKSLSLRYFSSGTLPRVSAMGFLKTRVLRMRACQAAAVPNQLLLHTIVIRLWGSSA